MALQTGTHDINSLLATRDVTVAEYGEDTVVAVLQRDLAAHNAIMQEMVSGLAEVTTDRQRRYGTSIGGEMIEVDEYGRAPTQKATPGSTAAFPLRLFQYPIGWTAKFFETATPADLASTQLAAQKAHARRIQYDIKRALYLSANYTYNDHLIDNVDLAVKRLVNADSAAIPDSPYGGTFDASTHTHYNANATLTAAALEANINDVIEHGHGGNVKLAIHRNNEAAVRGLSGFVAYLDPRLVASTAATSAVATLDTTQLDNRPIGIFAGAEVWIKPWAIENYYFVWDDAGEDKPLAFRQRSQRTLQGLRIAAQLNTHPLYAQYMEAEFGLGVWTRTNGAVLYVGGGSYVDPTITQ